MHSPLENCLTSAETCAYLRISRRTLQRMCAAGTIEYLQVGERYYFPLNTVRRKISAVPRKGCEYVQQT